MTVRAALDAKGTDWASLIEAADATLHEHVHRVSVEFALDDLERLDALAAALEAEHGRPVSRRLLVVGIIAVSGLAASTGKAGKP